MDKLKKVFSPGSSKDDEVLYGDAETRRRESAAKVHDTQPPQLHSTEGTGQEESGGVKRQILNPGGEDYDEYHGTTASTATPTQNPRKLSTTEEGQKDRTITDQILNPNREKYDEQRFGTTATSTDAPAGHAAPQTVSPNAQLQTDKGQKDHSILRQILNPHGDKYDAEGYGSTAHVVGQSSNTTGSNTGAGIGSSTAQGLPDRTVQTSGTDSHLGRDAAIVGGLGAAGGAGTYAATHDRDTKPATDDFGASKNTREHVGPTTTTTTTTTTTSQPITERSHPLGGQTVGGDHINPVSAPQEGSHLGRDAGIAGGLGAAGVGAGSYGASQHNRAGDHVTPTTGQANTAVIDRTHPLGGQTAPGDHINPISAPEDPAAASSTARTHPHLDRDAGIAGVGAAAGTTGIGASSQLNSAPRVVQDATYTARQYNIPGDNCSGTPAEGYVHHTQGPHSTDIANILDPHVPDEFPTESGEDRHRVGGTTGAVPATSIPAREPSLTQAQPGQTSDHHYGKDAALAGGLVGAGGTYAATRDRPSSTTGIAGQQVGSGNTTSTANVVGAGTSSSVPTDRGSSSLPGTTSTTTQTQPGQGHHYGRDAALGAGAGAAGYGAYGATQTRGDTGPASKTIGPHDSNIANIVDPRVQPQPELMKDSKTTGPHSSDLANKADPRVKETSAAGAAGAGAIGTDHKQTVGEKLYPDSTPTNRPITEHTGAEQHPYPGLKGAEDQHRGRDAALVGGAGALGGAGAYAATRDHDKPVTEQLASAQGTQTQPAYHATTDSSAATQPGTNLPDSRHRNKEAAHAGEAGLAGAGVGAGAGAFASGDQSAAKKTGPSAGAVDTPVQHTGDPKSIAATHRDDKGHSSSHTKEEEKEKKPSLIHRILHRGEGKEKEKESHHTEKKHDHGSSSSHSHTDDGHNKLHKKALGEGKTTEEAAHHAGGNDGRVIEPHTGLPMNTQKYGSGQGGTDGAQNIAGYHETDPAIRNASVGTGVGAGTSAGHAQPGQEGVAGPDWDAIKKANTRY